MYLIPRGPVGSQASGFNLAKNSFYLETHTPTGLSGTVTSQTLDVGASECSSLLAQPSGAPEPISAQQVET